MRIDLPIVQTVIRVRYCPRRTDPSPIPAVRHGQPSDSFAVVNCFDRNRFGFGMVAPLPAPAFDRFSRASEGLRVLALLAPTTAEGAYGEKRRIGLENLSNRLLYLNARTTTN